jgi:hypothetical protein
MRPLSESGLDQPCPECGAPAGRVVLSAAGLAAMPTATRKAYALNEMSRHEPRTSAQLKHGAGCGGSGKRRSADASASGTRTFPDRRPWMISH